MSQDHVGIGHGRVSPSSVVARRTGIRSGALRAYPKGATGIYPGDGPATRAEAPDIQRRDQERHAIQLEGMDPRYFSLAEGDIGRGASHVDGDQACVAGPPSQERRPQRASGGAR